MLVEQDLIEILQGNYPEYEVKAARTERLSPTRIVKCPRAAFMDSLGYSEPKTFQMDIIFEYGTMRHRAIQNILNDRGVLEDTEPWVEVDDPPIGGYCDGILRTEPKSILEIKTVGSPTKKVSKPHDSYLDQVHLYMYMTGLREGTILYESKDKENPKDWKIFHVDYNEERMQKILRKARDLLSCLEDMRLPPPQHKCFCNNRRCRDISLHKKLGLI